MAKQVKKSLNSVQVVGTLLELNLKMVEDDFELTNYASGKKKKVKCRSIQKVDFKQPTMLVESSPVDEDGNVRYTANIGVNFFNAYEFTLDEDGKIKKDKKGEDEINPNFKALETIMNTYITRKDSKDGEIPTRVKVDGSININEYPKDDDWKSIPQVSAFRCTSSGVPEHDIAEGEISGIIRNINQELKGGDSEEKTGRLKVELYFFDNKLQALPFNLVVEEDLADAFDENYKASDSVKLYFDILTRLVGGGKTKQTSAFRRREANKVSGFEITEFSVFMGDDPFVDESDYFIELESMKEAMKAREIKIEQAKTEAKEKAKKKTASGSSTGSSRGSLGSSRKPATKEEQPEEPADIF